jgi:glutamine amidotransferase
MFNVTVIDYGVGNLLSLKMSLEKVGAKVLITREKNLILNSSHIILPGVGAFPKAMSLIKKYNIDEYLLTSKNKGSNILGICLGMQLLMTSSCEFGLHSGLNFINGKVIPISDLNNYNNDIKIPNIGWHKIISKDIDNSNLMLNNISNKASFYFVHSFACLSDDPDCLKYYADYSNLKIPAIISNENIIGFQFHPEKSGKSGLNLLNNFLKL